VKTGKSERKHAEETKDKRTAMEEGTQKVAHEARAGTQAGKATSEDGKQE
jgi:hypothetical protein